MPPDEADIAAPSTSHADGTTPGDAEQAREDETTGETKVVEPSVQPSNAAVEAAVEPSETAKVDAGQAPLPRDGAEATSRGEPDGAQFDPARHPLVQNLLLHPSRWRIWPAVAVLKWLQSRMRDRPGRLAFRSKPSLSFQGSEVHDIQFATHGMDIVLNAPGLATSGSPLPSSDIARIVADHLRGGPLSAWLDAPVDSLMQVVQESQLQCNAAFALMGGGRLEASLLAADAMGASAPLSAGPGGELKLPGTTAPEGAVGLAAAFLGPASASGLKALFEAFTGLTTDIVEFAGATVPIGRPARVGLTFGLMLGRQCTLPTAAVEIHLQGGSRASAVAWAREPARRNSLHLLASSHIGGSSPEARVYLWLSPDNVPPAAFDGHTALGGLAVLGRSKEPVRLPLAPMVGGAA